MDRKPLPVGISNFAEVVQDFYYVDKSLLIAELLEKSSKVTLITRPRRFGKTLNMYMLKEFFDIEKDTAHLFNHLKIANTKWYKELNGYPTLFFSFKDSKGDELLAHMKDQLFAEYKKYHFIEGSLEDHQIERYKKIMANLLDLGAPKIIELDTAIRFLSEVVSKHYGKTVVILIDEYDTPMESAFSAGTYEKYRDFFTSLYSSALKDNPYLKMAVLTGIQRIAKENIFSNLNNLDVATVIDKEYNTCFGMTTEETQTLLEAYDLTITQDVKNLYDGYNFGGVDIYNPWSVINYAQKRELRTFWANTSRNEILKKSILESGLDFKESFEKLIADNNVLIQVDLQTSFSEIANTETLWGLLLNAGYITGVGEYPVQDDCFRVCIPNYEVAKDFKHIVAGYTQFGTILQKMFTYLITENDIEEFKKLYQKIVLQATSNFDAKENAYHMLFLGMCIYLRPDYEVKSNIEQGLGRSDIMLKSTRPDRQSLIIEFKQGENAEQLSKQALEQIKAKNYHADFDGDVALLGIGHNKKECFIMSELCATNT